LTGFAFLRRDAESFSPARQFRQLSGGAEVPDTEAGAATKYWILARSQYRVKFLALQHVAANRRDGAIKLELAGWMPFANTSHYVIPQPAGALLLAWDADAVAAAIGAAGAANRELSILPESALHPAAADGLTLRQCLEGMEAVVQAGGNTISSLWWREVPAEQDWMNFLRTSGLDSSRWPNSLPVAVAAQWLPQPLGHAPGGRTLQLAGREAWAVGILAFAFAVASLWYANDWRRYAQAMAASEQHLAATEQELDGILGARGTALSSLVRSESVAALFNRTDALNLLANISRIFSTLAKPGTLQLAEVDWRDQRLVLLLNVNGPPVSATEIVKALEANPAFREVQVNPDGNRMRVELRVIAGDNPAKTAQEKKS